MAQILREHVSAAAAGPPAKEMTIEQVREAARTEPALRDAAALQGRIPVISNAKARSVLGWRPRDVVETTVATADRLGRAWVCRAAGDPPGPVPAGVVPERGTVHRRNGGSEYLAAVSNWCCTIRTPVRKGSLRQERFSKVVRKQAPTERSLGPEVR